MDLGLAGTTAIVTGGASNIGSAIVIALAAEGARVWIADRDVDQAQRTADEMPDVVRVHETDVTDADSVAAMMGTVRRRDGDVDVLVNSAGWVADRLFVDKPAEEWHREIDVNYRGFLNCTRAVLDSMIERRRGRIISIGSDAGRIGEFREAVYSGAKAAVIATSKAIAREVGRYGVTLNVVCPGLVPPDPRRTGAGSMWRGDLAATLDPDAQERAAKRYPLRRLGTADDVAAAVLFLASDRASYITGQTLSVDGGYVMA